VRALGGGIKIVLKYYCYLNELCALLVYIVTDDSYCTEWKMENCLTDLEV